MRIRVVDGFIGISRGMIGRTWDEWDVMLFVFPQDVTHSFHTYFCPPMVMVFLDKDWKIIKTIKTKPNTIYKITRPYRYVIEVNPELVSGSGSSDNNERTGSRHESA